ncbi:hypothetical protein JCM1840_006355 [Sporobolomyces johnsonii]
MNRVIWKLRYLGVEMASTGEVAAFGSSVAEAYWASLTSTNGFKVPQANSGVLIGGDVACPQMATVAKSLSDQARRNEANK